MDLNTVKAKLESEAYDNAEQFESDVRYDSTIL